MNFDQQIVTNSVCHLSADGNDLNQNQNGMRALTSSDASPVIDDNMNVQPMLQTPHDEMQFYQNPSTVLTNGGEPQSLMQSQAPHGLMSPMVPMSERPENLSSSIHEAMSAATPMTPGPDDPRIVPQITNILSTANLCCKLDLRRIALHARNAEYNPERFVAVIMRIREPRSTALIFASGKLVCTGAKSEDESRIAARKFARIIQKLGFEAKFRDFKIHNMVGVCDVKFCIRLEGIVLAHSNFCMYEPELFPALVYRLVRPRIVLLIFCTGKVVVTGAKNRQDIYDGFDKIYPLLEIFKKH